MSIKEAQQERERLEQELHNTVLNRAEARKNNAQLDKEIAAGEQEAHDLAVALERVHPDERPTAPEQQQLRECVDRLRKRQADRDRGDMREEAAAQAERAVRHELHNSLYRHLRDHLAAAEKRAEWVRTNLGRLLPGLQECNAEWNAIVTEFKILGPALAEHLREADFENGVLPPASAYQRATAPNDWPLPNLEALASLTPTPSGVEQFQKQRQRKDAA